MCFLDEAGQGRVLPHVDVSVHCSGEGHVILKTNPAVSIWKNLPFSAVIA